MTTITTTTLSRYQVNGKERRDKSQRQKSVTALTPRQANQSQITVIKVVDIARDSSPRVKSDLKNPNFSKSVIVKAESPPVAQEDSIIDEILQIPGTGDAHSGLQSSHHQTVHTQDMQSQEDPQYEPIVVDEVKVPSETVVVDEVKVQSKVVVIDEVKGPCKDVTVNELKGPF